MNKLNPVPLPKKFPRKIGILIILLAVFATVTLVFLSYRAQAVNEREEQAYAADKARFAKVEAEMATAYEAIVAAVGTPDKVEEHKNCSRVAFKYNEGDLWCNNWYQITYGVTNIAHAYETTQLLQKAVTGAKIFSIALGSQTAESIDRTSSRNQDIEIRLTESVGATCEVFFDFKSSDANSKETAMTPFVAVYQFRCADGVSRAVYPLAE